MAVVVVHVEGKTEKAHSTTQNCDPGKSGPVKDVARATSDVIRLVVFRFQSIEWEDIGMYG